MESYGITAGEVNQQLRQVNVNAAGGRAQVGGSEQSIRVLGGASSAFELGDVRLTMPDGRVARLSEIADVRDGTEEVRTISRLNGRPATTFGVFKAKGASDVTTLHRIEAELDKIRTETPGVTLKQVFTTVDFTQQSYRSSIEALIEGALLAVVIVYVLPARLARDRNLGAGDSAGRPADLCVHAVVRIHAQSDDPAGVVADHRRAGRRCDRRGGEHHPTHEDGQERLPGGHGRRRRDRSGSGRMLGLHHRGVSAGELPGWSGRTVLHPVRLHRGGGGLHVAAGRAFDQPAAGRIHTQAARGAARRRRSDHGLVSACVALVGATSRQDAAERTADLRAVRGRPGTDSENLHAGRRFLLLDARDRAASGRAAIADCGSLGAGISDPAATFRSRQRRRVDRRRRGRRSSIRRISTFNWCRPRNGNCRQKQFEAEVIKELRAIPDAHVNFQSQSDGGGRDLTLYVVGSNPQLVERTAHEAIEQMRTLKELRDPRINGDMARPELLVRPHLDEAALLGVTVANISETVRLATLGDLPQNNAKFSLPDRQIPIRVSLIESARSNLATIENLPVRTASGATVPLKAVADISFGQGPSRLRRYNQQRRASLEADLNNTQLGTALEKIRAPADLQAPARRRADRRDRYRTVHAGAVH